MAPSSEIQPKSKANRPPPAAAVGQSLKFGNKGIDKRIKSSNQVSKKNSPKARQWIMNPKLKTDRVSASTDGKNLKDEVYRTNGTIAELSEQSKGMYASIRYKKNGIAKSLSKLQS